MNVDSTLKQLKEELSLELVDNILPYWMEQTIDSVNGGFVGRITHMDEKKFHASKGAILNLRLLWTFSAVYTLFEEEEYRDMAQRAYDYITANFLDPDYEGVYWLLKADGTVKDDRKHLYAQAFAVYAFSEYYHAFGEEKALNIAIRLHQLMEDYGHDDNNGGYFEAFSRSWDLLDDARLSEKDINEPKSMNTHLHLLEAYTNLYRYWQNERVRQKLEDLIDIFLKNIISQEGTSLVNFFSEDWTPKSEKISFGHDIEASWLLHESAEVLNDEDRLALTGKAAVNLARAVRESGIDSDGGIFNEGILDKRVDDDKDWWPQAEAMVGFLNAFELTGEEAFLQSVEASWKFIKNYMIDKKYGEWRQKVNRDGNPYPEDKVQAWKGPYHNSRACIEIISRASQLLSMKKKNGMQTMN